jgi:hypothetical protein
MEQAKYPKVLIIYYSLSSQTNGLVNNLKNGLNENGVDVVIEKIFPLVQLNFPIGTYFSTIKMMLITFFRQHLPIKPLSEQCFDKSFDLIILAGPTWSYNPSGPVLALLKRDGKKLFSEQKVIPLISCRGYWRMHWLGLTHLLKKHGAIICNRIIFTHPNPEPWRTIGVFLKLAGKTPEKMRVISKYYHKFGHSKKQREQALEFGKELAMNLKSGQSLDSVNFQVKDQ